MMSASRPFSAMSTASLPSARRFSKPDMTRMMWYANKRGITRYDIGHYATADVKASGSYSTKIEVMIDKILTDVNIDALMCPLVEMTKLSGNLSAELSLEHFLVVAAFSPPITCYLMSEDVKIRNFFGPKLTTFVNNLQYMLGTFIGFENFDNLKPMPAIIKFEHINIEFNGPNVTLRKSGSELTVQLESFKSNCKFVVCKCNRSPCEQPYDSSKSEEGPELSSFLKSMGGKTRRRRTNAYKRTHVRRRKLRSAKRKQYR